MSEKLTHDSLKPLVSTLPGRMREGYFEWRRKMAFKMAFGRAYIGHTRHFNTPEFVAECLQKLLALHAEVDKRLAMLSGDDYTDSDSTQHKDSA